VLKVLLEGKDMQGNCVEDFSKKGPAMAGVKWVTNKITLDANEPSVSFLTPTNKPRWVVEVRDAIAKLSEELREYS